MPALKITQVLGTTWTFELTARQAPASPTEDGERQPITGITNLTAQWRRLDSDTILDSDTGGFTIDEDSLDPDTFGDFTYVRDNSDQTEFAGGGTFRLRIIGTANGEPIALTQSHDVVVLVRA